jgi:hypothetical protein
MIFANLEHYTSMVDLFGCVGHLHEAKIMVMTMPYKPHVVPWKVSLFSAYRIHGNVELVECVAKQILEMELDNVVGYVLLSKIYVVVGNKHLFEIVEW